MKALRHSNNDQGWSVDGKSNSHRGLLHKQNAGLLVGIWIDMPSKLCDGSFSGFNFP